MLSDTYNNTILTVRGRKTSTLGASTLMGSISLRKLVTLEPSPWITAAASLLSTRPNKNDNSLPKSLRPTMMMEKPVLLSRLKDQVLILKVCLK